MYWLPTVVLTSSKKKDGLDGWKQATSKANDSNTHTVHSESIPDPFEFFHILLRYSLILTETHIIINVTGFSAYGIVHEEDAPISPIQGLVLIFYQPFVPEQRSILNVLLLPSNVVRKEVREVIERDGIREIQTTSQCKLTPKQEYTLSTYSADGHRIEPKEAVFVKCDSYENNYFQLFLQTIVKEVDLLLKEKEGDELVWNRLVWLPASPTDVPSTVSAVSPAAPTANPSTPPGRAFIRRNRMSLETRLGLLQPIFLRLQDRGVLIDEGGGGQ
ncbi:uncharacterized protein LOC118938516 [Oncorhynchus mykiss]|uniref:uncharacterized protein LOC118938516 n=1 Tax=Oncorhynchus mykiss TaxID=8022 RepID=UPI0018787784|nr:uncharacterized protein LOC118938516 [Oncorhynchus mykiss]